MGRRENGNLDSQQKISLKPPEEATPREIPDGGWGWVVLFAAFLIIGLISILVPGFGIIYSNLLLQHNASSILIAWIFNINQFLYFGFSIIAGPLCEELGRRKVLIFCGTIISASMIASGYLPRPEYLFITYSLLIGFVQGITTIVSFSVVPTYFNKKRGIAMGITMGGISAGHFIGPIFIRLLLENYGYRGATLILGAVLLHICPAGMVLHPVEWHSKRIPCKQKDETIVDNVLIKCPNESQQNNGLLNNIKSINNEEEIKIDFRKQLVYNKIHHSTWSVYSYDSSIYNSINEEYIVNKESYSATNAHEKALIHSVKKILKSALKNLKMLKLHRVQIISLSFSLIISGYINFIMIVPFVMISQGHSLDIITWAIFAIGLSNMISRILISSLTDILSISTRTYILIGTFGMFATLNAFTFVTNAKLIICIMSSFGFSVGTCICLTPGSIIEFMGLSYLADILGVNGVCAAIFFISLGPLFGLIRDMTESFIITTRIIALAPILAFILWFMMPLAVTKDEKNQQSGGDCQL